MKKESIIKILWGAFYAKAAYFIAGIIIIAMQKYIKPLYTTDLESVKGTVVPVSWIIGSFISLAIVFLIVITIKKTLLANKTAIECEIIAILIFGVFTTIGNMIFNYIVSNSLTYQYNYNYVQSYTTLLKALDLAGILSTFSNSAILVGCGMSLFYKKGMRR